MPTYRIPFGLVLLGLAPLVLPGEASADNSCIDCHKNPAFFAQYPKLHEYYQQWIASPHKEAGVTCDDCHGGDALSAEIEDAHKGVLHMKGSDRKVVFQGVHQLMGSDLGPKWAPGERRQSKMVFIGVDLPKDILLQGLEGCLV